MKKTHACDAWATPLPPNHEAEEVENDEYLVQYTLPPGADQDSFSQQGRPLAQEDDIFSGNVK